MNYRIHSLKQVVLFLTVITFLGLVTIVRAPSFAESFDFGEKEAALSMTDPSPPRNKNRLPLSLYQMSAR
jgi:hypothetical protein